MAQPPNPADRAELQVPNHRKRWAPEEDVQLIREIGRYPALSFEEIAILHGRKVGGIVSRKNALAAGEMVRDTEASERVVVKYRLDDDDIEKINLQLVKPILVNRYVSHIPPPFVVPAPLPPLFTEVEIEPHTTRTFSDHPASEKGEEGEEGEEGDVDNLDTYVINHMSYPSRR